MLIKKITMMVSVLCMLNALSIGQSNRLLKVGDKAPEINAYRWVKGKQIKDFQRGKVYVVEFGATWCKPCIAMIPHLAAIAKSDSANVEVISFFVMEYNNEKNIKGEAKYVQGVRDFITKQNDKINYRVAVDDPERHLETAWLKAAGAKGIPVTFIVDKNGMISWIGNDPENLSAIVAHVKSDDYRLSDFVKANEEYKATRPPFDPKKLYLVNGNGGNDSAFLYRSVMAEYKGDLDPTGLVHVSSYRFAVPGSKYAFLSINQGRIQETGASLPYLYYMAYGDTLWNQPLSRNPVTGNYPDTIKEPFHRRSYATYWYTPLIEVKDSSPFITHVNSVENKYNYSLKVPLSKGSAKEMQEAMQRDLKTYFGYNVAVETRMMPCWNLVRSDTTIDISTKTPGETYRQIILKDSSVAVLNAEMWDIILNRMIVFFSPHYVSGPGMDPAPFFDETGITSQVDFTITQAELDGFQHRDPAVINNFFRRLGLIWEKSTRPMKVVVIKDGN